MLLTMHSGSGTVLAIRDPQLLGDDAVAHSPPNVGEAVPEMRRGQAR